MKLNQQMKTTMSLAAAMGSLVLAATSANAATPIIIGEAGFEGAPNRGGVSLPPWERGSTGTSSVGVESYASLGASVDAVPGGGTYMHYNNGSSESIYQVLAATLAANTTYTFSIQAIDRSNLNFQSSELRLGYVSGVDDGTTGDTITNDFFGEFLLTPTVLNNTTPVNGAGASDGIENWVSTFTTGASPAGLGQSLRIEIVGSGVQSLYDNVSLTYETVPEPSTTALLGLGGLALILRRRK